jgi:C4-dicarboxylate-specific signal transduction histidine kinase
MQKGPVVLGLAGPTVCVSLLLLGLCIAAAAYLYRQQANTAEILAENVVTRKIDRNLEGTAEALLRAHRGGSDRVDDLQQGFQERLAEARQTVDSAEEGQLVARLEDSFRRYRECWAARGTPVPPGGTDPGSSAVGILQEEVVPACRELQDLNAQEIEQTQEAYRRTVRWMAWGLAGVGTVGSLAGVFLGYSVARGLRHSIHRLSIRVQDAAGRLSPKLPTLVVAAGGDLHRLDEQMHALVQEVERVLERLRQREREVLRAEQLAAVGQLAAGVAHELRNPLTTLKMLVQTNRREARAQGGPVDDFQIMEEEIGLMERCLQTFLDFARPPRPERRPLELGDVVESVLALVEGRARKQRVRLEFTRPPRPIIVEADGAQLQQLLVNLALNALDAMPQGGRLGVDLGAPVHGQVELLVQDTGPGVAPEILPRLFEPFVSGKETGLGLGLAVSRRIAEGHGGSLWVTNPPEGGARFVLRLPISEGMRKCHAESGGD